MGSKQYSLVDLYHATRRADSAERDGVLLDDDLAFLTSVCKVVVPGTQVIVRPHLRHPAGSQVKVRPGIVQFRHLSTKLNCACVCV